MSPIIIAHFEDEDTIRSDNFEVENIPDSCPICHKGIEPIRRFGWYEDRNLYAILQCPKKGCRFLFIGYYGSPSSGIYQLKACAPWKAEKKVFPKEVEDISAKFSEIYNQAKDAEKRGLKEICGAGYRRALEFLIKDYLIKKEVEDSEKIEKTPLGTCIDQYIDEPRIKECALRAAWLGNDETHYIRKWKDKDLDDLKNLIQLTVNWIYNEHLTERIIEEMPEKKANSKK